MRIKPMTTTATNAGADWERIRVTNDKWRSYSLEPRKFKQTWKRQFTKSSLRMLQARDEQPWQCDLRPCNTLFALVTSFALQSRPTHMHKVLLLHQEATLQHMRGSGHSTIRYNLHHNTLRIVSTCSNLTRMPGTLEQSSSNHKITNPKRETFSPSTTPLEPQSPQHYEWEAFPG